MTNSFNLLTKESITALQSPSLGDKEKLMIFYFFTKNNELKQNKYVGLCETIDEIYLELITLLKKKSNKNY